MAQDKVRCGIIGTGVWGETHLMAYTYDPGVDLVCICDKDEELLQKRQEEYGVANAVTDYMELLERDDIDAVSVVTPDFLHKDIVLAAADAGKDVLVEKPMATTVAECEAMIKAADKAGIMLMVDFHNRFNPAFTQVKQKLDAGVLGEPQMITLRLNDTIFVPTQMLSWGGESTVAWFLASHAADLARWFFQSEVRRVYSVSRSRLLKKQGLDTPDFFHSILEYENGAVAHIENCWIMSEEMPTVADFRGEMVCSAGTCLWNVLANRMVEVYEDEGGVDLPPTVSRLDIHGEKRGFAIDSIRHFAKVVREGIEPVMTAEDGLRNTEAVVAIHESAEAGEPVDLS
ncbi:MAG: Gfo/Idh/MocA family protein [Armatimonadota bacterium]